LEIVFYRLRCIDSLVWKLKIGNCIL